MKTIFLVLFCCVFLPLGAREAVEMPDRAESENGLLVIHGGHPSIRARLLQDGESLQDNLDDLVGDMPGDVVPVVLEFHAPRKGRKSMVRRRLLELPEQDGAYRFQVDVLLGAGQSFDYAEVRRTLLEMFLYERSVRGKSARDFGEKVLVRPWLVDGLLEAISWRKGAKDRDIYAYLAKAGGWLSVKKLIARENLADDGFLERQVFRASSGALVMALIAQPGGKESMMNYLSEVALFEGEAMTLVRKHFPSVNQGKNGLQKWWMLKVADMATSSLSEALTPTASDQRLESALKFRVKNEAGAERELDMADWKTLADLPAEKRSEVLRPVSAALSGLSYRSYPGYRPVIAGYLGVLRKLATGQGEGVAMMLKNLKTFREAEMRRMERVNDLMDWYYLSTAHKESGKFEDYLELKKNLENNDSGGKDRVSQYVDAVQMLFEKN